MVAGAQPGPDGTPSFDVALFVGYHARAGHPRGTIAHTYSGRRSSPASTADPTGEYGLNALALGAWGIPVGLVTGDDALAEEVPDWLPWAERVVVKTADGGHSAASVHPSVAAERVRDGAERAVRRAAAGELRTLEVGQAGRRRDRLRPGRPRRPRGDPAGGGAASAIGRSDSAPTIPLVAFRALPRDERLAVGVGG